MMMSSSAYPQPYTGAPPIPQGYNVNPSQWNTGYWQRNPQYNPNGAPAQFPQAAWVPGVGWGQPQQQQQNYNPYKRPVQPPSAAYLSQKLSDNPLGLSNMITREELYGPGVDGAPPETPWIWNPRSLDDSGSGPDPNSNRQSNNARQSSEPPPSAVHHRSQSQSLSRHASEPPPDNYQNHQEPAPAPLARPKKYAVSASAQAASTSAQGYQPQPPATSSASAYASSRAAAAAAAASNANNTTSNAPPAASTPTRQFRPTFSTRIVRTPDHYRHENSTPTNSNLTRSATMPSSTSGTGQSQTTPTRRASTGAGTVTDASVFVDEPGTLLSPLVMNTPMPPTSKPLGRHHTAPALSTIQEQASPSERHHHHHRRRSSSRHPDNNNNTPSKMRSGSSSKTPTPGSGAHGESSTNHTSYLASRNIATTGTSSASAAAAAALAASQSQSHVTPPNQTNTTSFFGNRTPNPLPTPPRIFDNPSFSRANIYSPPNASGTTPGVGSSSTTVAYTAPYNNTTTPVSANKLGSSTTSYGVIPASASTGISSASAQASRSRSQTRDRADIRDLTRDREPSQSRGATPQERSYSRTHSREPSRSRAPSREPSQEPPARRFPDRSQDIDNPYPFIAPDGTPPVPPGPEVEARIIADLAKRYKITGEPRRSTQRSGMYNGSGSGGISRASAVSSAPATTTKFEHFPLPTPPESFLEQRRQEAKKEEERLKREKEARDREQQQQQQQNSYHQSASSYQTPKTSPYSDNVNPSPQRSPSYAPQHSSASRQSSPYASPNNPTQQRTSPYPSPNNNVASTQRSPYPSPNNAPQRSPYPSPYSNSSSTQPSPRPSPSKHAQYAYQGGPSGTNTGGRRIRKGYWNSRGDHLTDSGFVVYAPADRANPPELASYPERWVGFQNEYGNIAKFEVGSKELPESIGRDAKMPYDSFVKYI
ncbi:uncharacterized protein C8R40DRAFT_743867 [Lentinula edodes]|uniref:uncharacterized protein n=1 Tax=Lentinula edodes TaxID=5353 RepID=UPI001E8E8B65|nr:uncharacterized protein C8R40DRAFT_743867 [Lentinula edodes]KAH7869432.1 hypothetical protein C8R40DRAFT_743867 [Lentinula edodes]